MRTVNCGLITKHALKIVSDSLIEPEQTIKWCPYEVEEITLRSFSGVFETKNLGCRGQSGREELE